MKTTVPTPKFLNSIAVLLMCVLLTQSAKAQTFTTIANGLWSSASTWQGGVKPNATNIPVGAVVNIRHIVTVTDTAINNSGTINIRNTTGLAPRLILPTGVNTNNNASGKIYIFRAEFRQNRFVGGGQTGTPQSGSFINNGGLVDAENSYVEIANDFDNRGNGIRKIKNCSVTLGGSYSQQGNGADSILFSSVSVGWFGGSNKFDLRGTSAYFQSARIQVASSGGEFRMQGITASGSIDYITLKNHVTNTVSTGDINIYSSVNSLGLSLSAYCVAAAGNYKHSDKFTGPQVADCALTNTYFPATLFASITPGTLNFSLNPVLIAGTDKQIGAQYKYEGVAPGIDAVVKIDSLVNGATITALDDNTPGAGYIEGFQPQIKAGPSAGQSYAVFSIVSKITNTNNNYALADFTLTALDIDGTATLKEFVEINMGPGTTSSFLNGNPTISLVQLIPGTVRGINISGITYNGVDTTAMGNMFTASNKNISVISLKMGVVTTTAQSPTRLFSAYFKGFVYPNITTLPVKLESFTAMLMNNTNKVDLKWTTSSEENTSHFAVERSVDGTNYSEIGIVFAGGGLSTKTNYSMVDDISALRSTIVYYRLRSVDHDSKAQYSEIRIIRISSAVDNKLTIMTYPNPVSNELRITVPNSWQNKQVLYELVSGNGTIVNKTIVANSSQTETMNVSNLAPGFYILRAVCNGVMAQQKIIKQ